MNMDRRLWIFPAFALLLAGACSKKTGGSVKLAKDTDSVAYVIGMNVGLNLQRMDSTINVEAVCEGIRDVFREKTRLSGEEAIYQLSSEAAAPMLTLAQNGLGG